MKTSIITKSLVILFVIAAGYLIKPDRLSAQIVTTLHDFTGMDGADPCSLILSSDTFYGTTCTRGSWGNGTIFKLNADGTAFVTLHTFGASNTNVNGVVTNIDGILPQTSLVRAGDTLFGTTSWGGSLGNGTVFAINSDGTGFKILHNFDGNEAGNPGGLIISGDRLYGIADIGGNMGYGALYVLNTDGTGFTNIYNFLGGEQGQNPGSLLLSEGILYGTASTTSQAGDPSHGGIVFSLNTNGNGFQSLFAFTVTNGGGPYLSLLSGNTLYGITVGGGASTCGTVFKLNTDGTGFLTLHDFTKTDGVAPREGMILSASTLYGTTSYGGTSGVGAIFAVNTDGTGFTTLHSFNWTNFSTPRFPATGPILSGNLFYMATAAPDSGKVFSLSFRPQLTINASTQGLVISWPTNLAGLDYTGYFLQSAATFDSPVWHTNLPAPVINNGQNTVAIPISGAQQFFRLSQ